MTHPMPPAETLLFRRQFLIVPHSTADAPAGWTHRMVGARHLYAHPDLTVTAHCTEGRGELLLLGFAIDPREPEADDAQILASLAGSLGAVAGDDEAFLDELDALSGRFLLLVAEEQRLRLFPDASALRRAVFTGRGTDFHAASDTALLRTVLPLGATDRLRVFTDSRHFRTSEENWLPADVTLHPEVHRLKANHVLCSESGEQARFWPRSPLVPLPPAAAATAIAGTLAASIAGAHRRFPLVLPLTAGVDSRTLLAATLSLPRQIDAYTLTYRDLVRSSTDVDVPRRLSAALGFPHRVIPCRRRPRTAWRRLYLQHSELAHHREDGRIASGIGRGLGFGRVALNGTVAEAGRDFYYRDGSPPPTETAADILALVPGWAEIPFVVDAVESWFAEARPVADRFGYELSSLFYWEHRTAGWQAQSQLEWDIVFDSFSPFSNRRLLERMLGVDHRLRLTPGYPLLYDVIRALSDDVLVEPVNRFSRADRMRSFLSRCRRRLLRAAKARRRARDLVEGAALRAR